LPWSGIAFNVFGIAIAFLYLELICDRFSVLNSIAIAFLCVELNCDRFL